MFDVLSPESLAPWLPTSPGSRGQLGLDVNDKLPWFPFYLNDWETDYRVRAMGPIARSYFLILLMVQWREGHIPDSRETLERLLTLPSDPRRYIPSVPGNSGAQEDFDATDYGAVLDQVLECFGPNGGSGLVNARLKSIRSEQLRVLEAKSRGGAKSARTQARLLQESARTQGVKTESDTESEFKVKVKTTM
jgi:hypothetical protein